MFFVAILANVVGPGGALARLYELPRKMALNVRISSRGRVSGFNVRREANKKRPLACEPRAVS